MCSCISLQTGIIAVRSCDKAPHRPSSHHTGRFHIKSTGGAERIINSTRTRQIKKQKNGKPALVSGQGTIGLGWLHDLQRRYHRLTVFLPAFDKGKSE